MDGDFQHEAHIDIFENAVNLLSQFLIHLNAVSFLTYFQIVYNYFMHKMKQTTWKLSSVKHSGS